MAANAGGGYCAQLVAGGDPGRLRSPGRTRAVRMPVRRWTERGATDSYGGGEGDGVRGVAYGAISPSG